MVAFSQQVIDISRQLSQDKLVRGEDGTVTVALTLTGHEIQREPAAAVQPVDLVVVLDRSGSMEGQKIDDARKAIIQVVDRMGVQDRVSVISYANDARLDFPLSYLDHRNISRVGTRVRSIYPGGGTNLGSGLQYGIETLLHTAGGPRQRKVILISDGLANQGITSLHGLANMAAHGAEHNFTISTVGVGYDFNEVLMTTIADHGAGSYYFLENPAAFARIFEKEFENSRNVIAASVELRIPVQKEMQLLDAGGYPLKVEGDTIVIRPGDVVSGQMRKIYLTYKADTAGSKKLQVDDIEVQYIHEEKSVRHASNKKLTVELVDDEAAAYGSIDRQVWGKKVVEGDYSRLQDVVADAIRKGKKDEALAHIEEYEREKSEMNAVVGSEEVATNLSSDVQQLRESVEDTFAGAPAEVMAKQKAQSKTLQYESYKVRRSK
jgi:Ca-activated chloride channel family protein